MKRILTNIIFAVLLSGVFIVGQAGQHKDSGVAVTISHVSFAVGTNDKTPQPNSGPHFTQGKAFQLNPRVDVSSKAILTTDRPALPSILVCLFIDPPVNQFTQGIYLRYRPRDPPSA